MSKHVELADLVQERIRAGIIRGKVPGERMLAQEMGVNFKTANRALSLLVDQGVLYRKRGEGTFVRDLSKRKAATIGLAFHKYRLPAEDPVFTKLFFAINQAAKDSGCRVDVTALRALESVKSEDLAARRAADRKAFIQEVGRGKPEGILFLGRMDREVIAQLGEFAPVLALGCAPPGIPTVRRDVRRGVAEAVRRLAGQGHRHIAFLTYPATEVAPDLAEKALGYREALAEAGLPFSKEITCSYPPRAQVLEALLECDPRPTAVVAAESTLGLAVLRHAPARRIECPRDLALVAFDDGDAGALTQPAMSGIYAYGEAVGQRALANLIERIDGKTGGSEADVLPCELVVRESSGGI